MAFQDSLYELRISRRKKLSMFADRSMEAICYYAYWASTELAKERVNTPASRGSLWDRGICRFDAWTCWRKPAAAMGSGPLVHPRLGCPAQEDCTRWYAQLQLRCHRTHSHHLQHHWAWTPRSNPRSATCRSSPTCPGEFTVINGGLVRDLKRLGLWDDVMIMDLKHFKGSLHPIDRACRYQGAVFPRRLKSDPSGWWVRVAKVDRSGTEPEHLHGWRIGQETRRHLQAGMGAGLKTTYYLRTQSATHVENEHREHAQLNACRQNIGSIQKRIRPSR